MTKRLEETFNLSSATTDDAGGTTTEDIRTVIAQNRNMITDVDAAIDKIDAALPYVRDLDTADSELDELALLAKSKAEDLIDLGMNVDPRFAGVILQTAGQLLGHSITAKTAKMDKKLKMIQLQLNKAKLDHQIAKDNGREDEPVDGRGMVLDRNALLDQILGKNRTEEKK
jgi:hypothetical protein